jgi:hypothetical protein
MLKRIHVSSDLISCFHYDLVFFDIGVGFGDGNFSNFPHHFNLVGASSYALSDVHLEAGWGVGATEGEWNDDAQCNQDDGDGVDDDSFFDHSRVCVFATNHKFESPLESSVEIKHEAVYSPQIMKCLLR